MGDVAAECLRELGLVVGNELGVLDTNICIYLIKEYPLSPRTLKP